MSELTLTIIRLGFLAVLWLFVLTAVSVMRSDLFGRRVAPRPAGGRVQVAARAPKSSKQPKPPKPAKGKRGLPTVLVVTQGALSGTSVRLGAAPVTMGRSQDSTIVIDDDYVSSRHARVFPRDGEWWVEDLGSTNGTYLDRTKVITPTQVKIGVPIRVGKTVVELRK
jgi:pSer/pThr/pTyr-binding forkhead associated (FHA) protein